MKQLENINNLEYNTAGLNEFGKGNEVTLSMYLPKTTAQKEYDKAYSKMGFIYGKFSEDGGHESSIDGKTFIKEEDIVVRNEAGDILPRQERNSLIPLDQQMFEGSVMVLAPMSGRHTTKFITDPTMGDIVDEAQRILTETYDHHYFLESADAVGTIYDGRVTVVNLGFGS